MKLAVFALVLSAALPLGAQPAPRMSTPLPAAELTALEAARKEVWVRWFEGDTAALRRMLSPELVAMSTGDTLWQSLDQTIAASAAFKRDGGKFVSVAFDSRATHHFNGTAVLFARYTIVTERKGKRATSHGRLTEVFVRSGPRWVHTSWHLEGDR
ncbi:MAG: nuclear transport factor 2 family protein [Gemmatimonadetes bacterium]|nr:nuclear transport factor 2 family protein [Gemmatimonadota bacterium]